MYAAISFTLRRESRQNAPIAYKALLPLMQNR